MKEKGLIIQIEKVNLHDSELLKLRIRGDSSSRLEPLSDYKRDILRWQDDGAPPSPLDDDLM